jgi:hypothetical protein
MENIKDRILQKPGFATNNDIPSIARQGLERALAARQSMARLSVEQAEGVGGGFALCLNVAGGFLSDAPAWAIQDKVLFTTGQGIDEGHPDLLIRDI